MKRILRDLFRFDVFDLFTSHAQQERVRINSEKAVSQFVDRVRTSVQKALESDTFVCGHHTQALFEALTLSLGAARVLKKEDAGEVYADEEMIPPDYHLVVPDGQRLLVEVKNLHQEKPTEDRLIVKKSYLASLLRYSEIIGCPLRLAVFWVRWNIWTLVSPDALKSSGERHELSMTDAFLKNDMALLGDKMVGTASPLKIRVIADATKRRFVQPDGNVRVTITDVKLLCGETEITDSVEKNIAWYLSSYGKWELDGPAEAKIVDGQLDCFEERYMPDEDHVQGFEIIGSLSGMYSTFYRQATADEGRIGQVRLETTPGTLARLIPANYKGGALPLWIIIQTPANPLSRAPSHTTER